jgi:hypothetical protein
MRGQVPAARGDPRPGEHAGFDGIARGDSHEPGGARIAHRRDAGTKDLLRVPDRTDRPVLHRGVEVELLLGLDLAVVDMAVRVDEPGHDGLARDVDDAGPDLPRIERTLDLGARAERTDAAVGHEKRSVRPGGGAGAVDQCPADEKQRLRCHLRPSVSGRGPGAVLAVTGQAWARKSSMAWLNSSARSR